MYFYCIIYVYNLFNFKYIIGLNFFHCINYTMNTEALFLFLILLLSLVLCSFLGGNCGNEGFTNNYLGTKLTNGTKFYGENGSNVTIINNTNGTQTLQFIKATDKTPILFTTRNPTDTSATRDNTFYGPSGATANIIISDKGKLAVKVQISTGTYYLKPGSDCSNFLTGIFGTPFNQKVIVFEGLVSPSLPITGSQVVTVNFIKSTSSGVVGTTFASLVLNSSTHIVQFTNISSSFEKLTDFLQIQVVVSGDNLTAGCDIIVGVSTY